MTEPTFAESWQAHSARYDAEQAAQAATQQPAQQPPARTQRHDGWTPDRQRVFLDAVAEGFSTERACQITGLSPSSAYAFKKRANGRAFALAWRAAQLLGRDRIADTMMARAIDGYTETVTRANGDVIERHRFDNRLAMQMLTRLDRMAQADDPAACAANADARAVAGEFDAFLDLLDADAPAARAAHFLAARLPAITAAAHPPAAHPAAEVLTRADRFARAGVALAAEVDTHDLDPADRAGWTLEQWQRADAAGLIAAAPSAGTDEEDSGNAPLPPLHPELADEPDGGSLGVYYNEGLEEWRTDFPPPPGFDGDERGSWGDDDYDRTLTEAELAVVEAEDSLLALARRRAAEARRETWFAICVEDTEALRAALEAEDEPDWAAVTERPVPLTEAAEAAGEGAFSG
jgi:hypothetical protein